MKKQKSTKQDTRIQELSHDTVPATVGLVKEIRDELRADIRSVDYKVEALDHKVDGLRSDIRVVEHSLNSKIEQVVVAVHRTQVLMEEQRGENRIVLDGIKTLIERQDRLETDVGNLRGAATVCR